MFKEFQQSDSCCWQKCSIHLQRETLGLVLVPEQEGDTRRAGEPSSALGWALLEGSSQHTDFPVSKTLVIEKRSTKTCLRGFFSPRKKNMSFLPAFLALHFDSSSGAEVGALAGGFRNSPRASTDQSGSFVNRS